MSTHASSHFATTNACGGDDCCDGRERRGGDWTHWTGECVQGRANKKGLGWGWWLTTILGGGGVEVFQCSSVPGLLNLILRIETFFIYLFEMMKNNEICR